MGLGRHESRCAERDPPVPKRRTGIALTPARLRLLIESATGCWCLPVFLEISAATGARRGEVLALRWTDIENGAVTICRSLSQTKAGLAFKETKTETPRVVVLPQSALKALEAHKQAQQSFKQEFGRAYKGDLDLIFANPDGTLLKPYSISSSVSLLFLGDSRSRNRRG